MSRAKTEIWFTAPRMKPQHKQAIDYKPIKMEKCLNPMQCKVVKTFLRELIDFKKQTGVNVSRFMHIYRKERNGAYYCRR